MAAAVAARFEQDSTYGLFARTKKLVVVERWLLWSEVAFSAGSTVVLRGTNCA